MKTLKFTPELCDLIIQGEKTTTWRLFDDKDLQEEDKLIFINKVTGQSFGQGVILRLKTTTLRQLVENDWEGHERFSSETEMYETYRSYYGPKVGPDSVLKIINFNFEFVK